ncbi:hypothetical protein OESDEN_19918 [Oesophagostomum dentatum]|uniref:Pao retrotransposon peptidase n=1 Tax=Oesophagostomum dentatum TaxID=61180 RepID=A0A0B1S4Y0_OESDE|nr:hypothetical protein OESDEN_19918 [Oesophagostomum dentatum]
MEIARNLYVDNVTMTADTVKKALQKYKESKELFAKIGMNLREYASNSQEVNIQIPEHDRLEEGPIKLLGVKFDIQQDTFSIKTHFPVMTKLTKKDIVSQINSVFDPIGLTAPLLVNSKRFMRQVFDLGVDWKTSLEPSLCAKWNKLCKTVTNATTSIPRSISHLSSGAKRRLWVFADASQIAIATSAYMQCPLTGSTSSN